MKTQRAHPVAIAAGLRSRGMAGAAGREQAARTAPEEHSTNAALALVGAPATSTKSAVTEGSRTGSQAGGASALTIRFPTPPEAPAPAAKAPPVSGTALRAFVEELEAAQWFTGKGRGIAAVQIAESAALPLGAASAAAFVALLEVTYADGGRDTYHVPFTLDEGGRPSDALAEPAFVRAMIAAVRDRATIPASSGALQCAPIPGAILPADTEALAVEPLGVPQSNVSIRVGEDLIFKAYRKAEIGVSIEREVTAHLTAQGYANTPQLLGTVELDTAAGPATLGLVFEHIQSDGDGWSKTLAALGALAAPDKGAKLLEAVALLGTRIGEMHKALGAPTADPAFAPKPVSKSDLGAWRASIARELDETIALAQQKNARLAVKLTDARPALLERLTALETAAPRGEAGQKTRIHGDLHLGQVLSRDGDWVVLDFEGEPAREKSERRGLYTPLRDVAGMLRSFGYAEAEARKNGGDVPDGWAADAGKAFLAAWRAAVAQSPLAPADEKIFAALLEAMELEKALYEVRYELVSRPALVHIPAARVLELARGA
jgi:maltokinase